MRVAVKSLARQQLTTATLSWGTLTQWVRASRQLAQFLTATGRRLRALGKVAGHFFRKGKLGLKLAIKIPFFVEIEIAFETDWDRRR